MPDQTVPPPIPPAVRTQIDAKIAELEALLAPYLRSLTDEERRHLAKMGPDSVEFVQNAQAAVGAKPDVMPRRFDPQEFEDAFSAAQSLAPIVPRLDALSRGVDDADMLAGSAAYNDALEVYAEFRGQMKTDSSLIPFYDAMAQRFAKFRGPRTPKPPTS